MAIRKFLTSVADVFGYDENDNLILTGKTLLDSSIEVSLGSSPVRGGRGSQLQYVYYHTGEMKFSLTDTQWNLAFLGATVGSEVTTGNNIYKEETVTLDGAGSGTVTGTPLAFTGSTLYGWATSPAGVTERITFTGSAFTVGAGAAAASQLWCIRYYAVNAASTSIKVNANMIPKIMKLVMETQLNSADVSTNKIGIVQIIAPTVTLSGAFTISMKSDGVSNTPLTASALAYTDSVTAGVGCSTTPYYAKLIEIIDSANWYDNVIALSVSGGDYTMGNSTTSTLVVWAIPAVGAAFKPDPAALDFNAVGVPTATGTTVGLHTGIITSDATDGTIVVKINITAKTAIDTTVTVTVA
jgi:hypothetical protein